MISSAMKAVQENVAWKISGNYDTKQSATDLLNPRGIGTW
jgi:hypothetical protein